ISSFLEEEIYYVNDIMNEYPRRIFNGLSAEEVFHTHYVLPSGPRVALSLTSGPLISNQPIFPYLSFP
ncbi:MAG: hypothetical protein SOY59_07960, partial [Ligilactobacillus agilis]|nr:hypothetical protein [Ligilactobacillus agilis]